MSFREEVAPLLLTGNLMFIFLLLSFDMAVCWPFLILKKAFVSGSCSLVLSRTLHSYSFFFPAFEEKIKS